MEELKEKGLLVWRYYSKEETKELANNHQIELTYSENEDGSITGYVALMQWYNIDPLHLFIFLQPPVIIPWRCSVSSTNHLFSNSRWDHCTYLRDACVWYSQFYVGQDHYPSTFLCCSSTTRSRQKTNFNRPAGFV